MNNYQQLLGKKSWDRLHPEIKKRFGDLGKVAMVYQGKMKHVKASLMGLLFAYFCRLIGTPLAFRTGTNIPVTVKVYPNQKLNGMTWDRRYDFGKGKANRVTSTKCVRETDGLVERVGMGFGMKLKVTEVDSAIHFESTEFFWEIGQYNLRIPDIMTPGKTSVYQKALNKEAFEFGISVIHPVFGEVFNQVGKFQAID